MQRPLLLKRQSGNALCVPAFFCPQFTLIHGTYSTSLASHNIHWARYAFALSVCINGLLLKQLMLRLLLKHTCQPTKLSSSIPTMSLKRDHKAFREARRSYAIYLFKKQKRSSGIVNDTGKISFSLLTYEAVSASNLSLIDGSSTCHCLGFAFSGAAQCWQMQGHTDSTQLRERPRPVSPGSYAVTHRDKVNSKDPVVST